MLVQSGRPVATGMRRIPATSHMPGPLSWQERQRIGMKLKSVDETHVYISENGYLAIKQVNGMGEESLILLSQDYARIVADEITKLVNDDTWWMGGVEQDD